MVPKRYCTVEGCTNGIIRQGVCKKHGAKLTTLPKKRFCKVDGCEKQVVKWLVCHEHGAKCK